MEPQNNSGEKCPDWKIQLCRIEYAERQTERPCKFGLIAITSVFIAIFLAVAGVIYFALFKMLEMQTEIPQMLFDTKCGKSSVVAVTVFGIVIICALGIMGYVILSNAAKTYKSEMDVYNKFRQSINDLRIKSLK